MDSGTRLGPRQSRAGRAVNLKHCSSLLGSMFGMCKGSFQSKQSRPHTAEKIAGNCKQGELLFVISSSLLPHVLLAGLLCIRFFGTEVCNGIKIKIMDLTALEGKEKTPKHLLPF